MRHKSLVVLLLSILVPAGNAQRYKIVDLGSLGGGYSEAYSINEIGNVVGLSCVDLSCVEQHPFLWSNGIGMQDLGTLPGGSAFAYASGINLLGEVVGSSAFSSPFDGDTHAFLWTMNGGMKDLGTLGCPDITGANGINQSGQVAGTSTIEPCAGGGLYRAFVWSDQEGMQDLGTLFGGTYSLGNAINALGQVVGYSDCSNCDGSHPFLWDSLGSHDLGVLPGGSSGAAIGLNDFGDVVGMSDSAHSIGSAFLWTQGGGMVDLGILVGGQWSAAYAVNDFGQVVGASDTTGETHRFRWRNGRPTASGSHAFIWSSDVGMRDLNHVLIPQNSRWLLTQAHAINSSGQIVGTGTINGETHAFLLLPQGRGH